MAKSIRGVYSAEDSGCGSALVVLVAEEGDGIQMTTVGDDKNLTVSLSAPAARRLGERLIQAAEAAASGEVSRD